MAQRQNKNDRWLSSRFGRERGNSFGHTGYDQAVSLVFDVNIMTCHVLVLGQYRQSPIYQ